MAFVTNLMNQINQYKDADGVINIPNDDNTTGKEIFRLAAESSSRPKRPSSGYFLWLNDIRQNIKETYFSDYDQIDNWDMDSKKAYYLEKGLVWKDDAKAGKPKIVALVTSKAGLMWKEISESDKKEYLDKSQILKDEYSLKIKKFNEIDHKVIKKPKKSTKETPTVSSSENKSKKGRGRPKKVKEEVNAVTEVMVEQSAESTELNVTEEIVNGKTYYFDESSGQMYDPESGNSVGEKCEDGTYKWN